MVEDKATPKSATPVDRHIGACIRRERELRGLSRRQLAKSLKISFQQLQKYEDGQNRISAARLFDIALLFQVPIGLFFP